MASRPVDGRRFLVIGGTQFMGRHMIETLMQLPGNPSIVMLNRGKTPVPQTIQEAIDAGTVEHWHCDRLGDRSKFRSLLTAGGHFDAIIDFVAFGPSGISDVARAASVGHYVFISSDSVYMACPYALAPTGVRVREQVADAVRSDEERRALKLANSYQFGYGGNKLQCEKMLKELAGTRPGWTYTALRLPDVIGPYDNLGGILELQTRVQQEQPVGLEIPGGCGPEHRLSFVFAADVARAALSVLDCCHTEAVLNRALNISCTESATPLQLIQMVAQSLSPPVQPNIDEAAEFDFSSVTFGPVDNSAALVALAGWRPTPLAEAIARTVEWNSTPTNAEYSRKLAISTSDSDSSSESFESSSESDEPHVELEGVDHSSSVVVSEWAAEFDIANVRDGAVLVVGRPDGDQAPTPSPEHVAKPKTTRAPAATETFRFGFDARQEVDQA